MSTAKVFQPRGALAAAWLVALVALGSCASQEGEGQQRRFLAANARYEGGDYRGALQGYLGVAAEGVVRAHLYYNTGNCYAKLGELGKAVLHYERALRLAPRLEDAKYNLAVVRSRTVDEVSPPGETKGLGEAIGGGAFSSLEAWRAAAVSYVLLFLVLALSLFLPGRRYLAYTRLALLALCLCSLILLAYLGWQEGSAKRGVVMSGEVSVRDEPRADAAVEFKLHEGTVVRMLGRHEGWQAVTLGEELKGWVEINGVEGI